MTPSGTAPCHLPCGPNAFRDVTTSVVFWLGSVSCDYIVFIQFLNVCSDGKSLSSIIVVVSFLLSQSHFFRLYSLQIIPKCKMIDTTIAKSIHSCIDRFNKSPFFKTVCTVWSVQEFVPVLKSITRGLCRIYFQQLGLYAVHKDPPVKWLQSVTQHSHANFWPMVHFTKE